MSIIQILKEDYLFEDEDNPVMEEPQTAEEVKEDEGKEIVSKEFVIKLTNYLEKIFPQYGTFDDQIFNEIRNYMDQTDNKAVKKIKEKIHGIIIDEKKKLLKRIQTRMERLKVPKKEV